jgi:hypothetical protein
MWRPLQDGQTPRPLQENATTNPVRHVMQTARAKPKQRSLDPRSLYTFRKLAQLPIPPDLLARYPNTVQRDVGTLLERARN